jgi:hypothetical protein
MLRFGLKEWKEVRPYLLKDFYTLTPWHKEKDTCDFTAFCFYDPEKENGVILAFRQENCLRERISLVLPFADPDCSYRITDKDSGEQSVIHRELCLRFPTPRSSKLLWIEKV